MDTLIIKEGINCQLLKMILVQFLDAFNFGQTSKSNLKFLDAFKFGQTSKCNLKGLGFTDK